MSHPTLLWDSTQIKGFGVADLHYLSKRTDFRTAQTEREHQAAAFEARGYNKIGSRVYVSGSFQFRKTWQDSLAFALRGPQPDGMPTYYFVPKAGKFERQIYQATAHVGYALKPNKWRTDLQMDYLHHWATRSVDPRMEHYTMQLVLKPSLSYRLGTLQTTLQGIWGYANAQTNLSYKHTPYTFGNAFPEYHYRTSYGYGNISLALDSSDMRQYDHYKGIALLGKTHKANWELLWHGEYLHTQQNSTNDQRRMVGYFVKQRFSLDAFRLSFFGIHHHSNPLAIRLVAEHKQGEDFNGNMRSKNYLWQQSRALVGFTKTLQSTTHLPKEFGVETTITHDERTDGSTNHYMQRTWVDVGMPLAITYVLPAANRIRWTLRPSYRISLHNELNIPNTQYTIFSTGIAYPEHYYYGTNALSLQTRLAYIGKTSVRYPFGLYIDLGWTRPDGYHGEIYPGTKYYSGNNTALQLGLNFYL
ncbi:hypothetical protein C5749_05475 [Sphingobacterium gobiense]|uniref:DUF6850 domain-containing protein n=1 Tax=Sphingobacterium gobiense TaxID=1382456 RepID=A0A2S9JU57_9SPHI|nr:hypothetical protein C5749_05475 [Sphingobacterium gobiense]